MLFDLKDSASKQKIVDMIKEYRDNIRPGMTIELQKKFTPNEQRNVVEQTKFLWISKDQLLELFSKNADLNGIRVYFAAHKESTLSESDNHKEYQGQLTTVLVPTHTDGKESTDIHSHDMLDGTVFDLGPLCPPDCPHPGTKLLFS
jgi:hypothetical protein